MTAQAPEPKFLVDATAARLSRWLRFLGYDAVLDRGDSDAKLLARARKEGRVLLTRKRGLGAGFAADAKGGVLPLSSDFLPEQLRQVAHEFRLERLPMPRCTVCNSELSLVTRAEADGRVPEFVYQSHCEFAYCPQCDKYYWKGTHWDHAGRTASDALSGDQEPGQS